MQTSFLEVHFHSPGSVKQVVVSGPYIASSDD